jgi:hypothetical protein
MLSLLCGRWPPQCTLGLSPHTQDRLAGSLVSSLDLSASLPKESAERTPTQTPRSSTLRSNGAAAKGAFAVAAVASTKSAAANGSGSPDRGVPERPAAAAAAAGPAAARKRPLPSGFAPLATANVSPPPPATVPKLNFGSLAAATSLRDDPQRAKSAREATLKVAKGGRMDARSAMSQTPRGMSTAGAGDKEAGGLGVLSPRQAPPRLPLVSASTLVPKMAASKAPGSDSSPQQEQLAPHVDAGGAHNVFVACETRSPRSSRTRSSSGRVDYLAMAAAHRELIKGTATAPASGEGGADAEERRVPTLDSVAAANVSATTVLTPPEETAGPTWGLTASGDGADALLVRGSSGRTPPSVPPVRVRPRLTPKRWLAPFSPSCLCCSSHLLFSFCPSLW